MGVFDKFPKPPKPPMPKPTRINPASGLPMIGGRIGGVDVAGNPFGTTRKPFKPNPFPKPGPFKKK